MMITPPPRKCPALQCRSRNHTAQINSQVNNLPIYPTLTFISRLLQLWWKTGLVSIKISCTFSPYLGEVRPVQKNLHLKPKVCKHVLEGEKNRTSLPSLAGKAIITFYCGFYSRLVQRWWSSILLVQSVLTTCWLWQSLMVQLSNIMCSPQRSVEYQRNENNIKCTFELKKNLNTMLTH